MIQLKNYLGTIVVTKQYLVELIASTVSSCFGVAGISNKRSSLLHPSSVARGKRGNIVKKGVRVEYKQGVLSVELHIFALYGVNLTEIVRCISNKVRFTLEEATGESVSHVGVFIDGIRS